MVLTAPKTEASEAPYRMIGLRNNPYTPNPELKVWMNGQLVPSHDARINVFDHGILYGDGIFEGIRIYNGRIFKEAEHVRRLFESAKAIRLDFGMTPAEVSRAMAEAMEANRITGNGYIRLVVTRGVGSLGISTKHTAQPLMFIVADKIALYPPELYQSGLQCVISSYARNHHNSLSPRVKSLNYLNNILAKLEAQDAGANEAIMLNTHGRIAEATGDNLFIVRGKRLETPMACEGLLEGITRGVVLEIGQEQGFEVRETLLTRHDLYVADEVFLTGTAAEIISVVGVDRRPIGDGKPGKVTQQLLRAFREYVAAGR